MDNAFLVPAQDADGRVKRVPIPGGDALPAAGAHMPLTPYWRRRLADGDCARGTAPARPDKPPAPKDMPRPAPKAKSADAARPADKAPTDAA